MANSDPTWGGTPHRRTPSTHCKDCNVELNESNWVFKATKGVHINRCRNCWNKFQSEYQAKRRAENEGFKDKRVDAGWKSVLKTKYGITEEQYWEIYRSQGGVCAICKFPCTSGDKLSVDHCHQTNKVRGLLCRSCNLALAAVNESEDLIYSLLDYLRQHNDPASISLRPSEKKEQ